VIPKLDERWSKAVSKSHFRFFRINGTGLPPQDGSSNAMVIDVDAIDVSNDEAILTD